MPINPDVPVPRPARRALYTSSALQANPILNLSIKDVPRRPIICDCGQRAGNFQPNTYYCSGCQIIVRCYPTVGRVEWSREQWEADFPNSIDPAEYEASSALKPEDPEIY